MSDTNTPVPVDGENEIVDLAGALIVQLMLKWPNEAVLSDFAKEHGYQSADEMAVADPELYEAIAGDSPISDKEAEKIISSAVCVPTVQDETAARAKKFFDLIDRKGSGHAPAEQIARKAMERGATTAAEFGHAFTANGLRPALAELVGCAVESQFKLAALDAAEAQAKQGAA